MTLVAGRYRADSFLAHGSCGTSTVWRGSDAETGDPIVVKIYSRTESGLMEPELLANEIEAHRDMIDCRLLAQMLAFDLEHGVVVKRFIDGPVLSRRASRDPGSARTMLFDLATILADGARAGRSAHHAFAINNLIETSPGHVASVEVCNSQRGWLLPGHAALESLPRMFLAWAGQPPQQGTLGELLESADASVAAAFRRATILGAHQHDEPMLDPVVLQAELERLC